jgi:hypothetical protein
MKTKRHCYETVHFFMKISRRHHSIIILLTTFYFCLELLQDTHPIEHAPVEHFEKTILNCCICYSKLLNLSYSFTKIAISLLHEKLN